MMAIAPDPQHLDLDDIRDRWAAEVDTTLKHRWFPAITALVAEVERLRAEVDSQKFVINRQATLLAIATEQDAAR